MWENSWSILNLPQLFLNTRQLCLTYSLNLTYFKIYFLYLLITSLITATQSTHSQIIFITITHSHIIYFILIGMKFNTISMLAFYFISSTLLTSLQKWVKRNRQNLVLSRPNSLKWAIEQRVLIDSSDVHNNSEIWTKNDCCWLDVECLDVVNEFV